METGISQYYAHLKTHCWGAINFLVQILVALILILRFEIQDLVDLEHTQLVDDNYLHHSLQQGDLLSTGATFLVACCSLLGSASRFTLSTHQPYLAHSFFTRYLWSTKGPISDTSFIADSPLTSPP